jgi:hypothetical protein
MPRRPTPQTQYRDVPLPLRGLADTVPYVSQPPHTSAALLNVRPHDVGSGRRRLSRRAGLAKYVASQVSTQPIQDLITIAVPRDQTAGTADIWTQSDDEDNAEIYLHANGASQYVGSTLGSDNTLGCVDEDGNFYAVGVDSNADYVLRKVNTSYTESWSATLNLTASGTPSCYGIAVFEDVVYLWCVGTTADGVYRFNASTGARLDAGAWSVTGATMVGIAPPTANCYQCIAAGGGLLGMVGGLSGALVLQQINISTATIVKQTTIQGTFEDYRSKLVTDQGANFFVATNVANSSGNCAIYRVLWTGAIPSPWPLTGTYCVRDIAWDPVAGQLGVVGEALFGTSDSFQVYTPAKVKSHGSQPTSNSVARTAWLAIAADGLSGFHLRRDGGTDDMVSLSDVFATNWTVSTSLPTGSRTLWMACSGGNISPTPAAMQSLRVLRALAVSGGTLYRFDSGSVSSISTAFTSAAVQVVFSTILGTSVYYVDGTSYPTYNARTNVAGSLTASDGTLPTDINGNKCRLVCTWRNRLVMAGLISSPHNWFMSAVGDATDFQYSPGTTAATQAVSGTQAEAGESPDIVQTLIPWSDEILIFGCDHSVYQMSGDPMEGGRFDLLSGDTGMAWGRPWCKDPSGLIYFFGSRGAIWRLEPGKVPERISEAIDTTRLFPLDLNDYFVRMAWDDRWRGFNVYLTPKTAGATTHYFWCAETGSWWADQFANTNHDPIAVHVHDGDDPADRVILLGGRDGYIRCYSDAATGDDGTAITSYVDVGPVQSDGRWFKVVDLRAVLGASSPSVSWALRGGATAEAAYGATALFTGTFAAGRNLSQAVRLAGAAQYLRLSASAAALPWSVEHMEIGVQSLPDGAPRRRTA